MYQPKADEWRSLLTLILAQRLEINALESALTDAGIVSGVQLRGIRSQASNTATAWSARETDDVIALLRIHSSASAAMRVSRDQDDSST